MIKAYPEGGFRRGLENIPTPILFNREKVMKWNCFLNCYPRFSRPF